MKPSLTFGRWISLLPWRIFEGILRFARSGTGDVVALQGDLAGSLRLRIGDYRVLFTLKDGAMHILGVRHRSKAYR